MTKFGTCAICTGFIFCKFPAFILDIDLFRRLKCCFTSWAKHEPGFLFAIDNCALFAMRVHGHWNDKI